MRIIPKHIKILIFITIIVILAIIAYLTTQFANYVAKKPQEIKTLAGTEKEVQLNFNPPQIREDPGEEFFISPTLLGPTDKKISSILISIKFDKDHILFKGVEEKSIDGKVILLKTSNADDAKAQGVLKILFGAESADNAPQNGIILPKITFQMLKEGTSSVNYDLSQSEVVFDSTELAELKETGQTTITTQKPTDIISPTTTQSSPSATLIPTSSAPSSPPTTNNPQPTTTPPTNPPTSPTP